MPLLPLDTTAQGSHITCDMREWFVSIHLIGGMVTQIVYSIWLMCQMPILYLYNNRAQKKLGRSCLLFGASLFFSPLIYDCFVWLCRESHRLFF